MKYYEDKSDRKMELKLLSLSEDDKLIRECMEQASAFYGCLGKMGVTEILCDRKKAQELGADCQITGIFTGGELTAFACAFEYTGLKRNGRKWLNPGDKEWRQIETLGTNVVVIPLLVGKEKVGRLIELLREQYRDSHLLFRISGEQSEKFQEDLAVVSEKNLKSHRYDAAGENVWLFHFAPQIRMEDTYFEEEILLILPGQEVLLEMGIEEAEVTMVKLTGYEIVRSEKGSAFFRKPGAACEGVLLQCDYEQLLRYQRFINLTNYEEHFEQTDRGKALIYSEKYQSDSSLLWNDLLREMVKTRKAEWSIVPDSYIMYPVTYKEQDRLLECACYDNQEIGNYMHYMDIRLQCETGVPFGKDGIDLMERYKLSKFSPGCAAEGRSDGEYYKAYYEVVSQIKPKSDKTPVITPHIDRNWHIVSALPDLDEENQRRQEREIYRAFALGIICDLVCYSKISEGKYLYRLELNDLEPEEFVVSNGTPCDHYYEVLDALTINPVAVQTILSYMKEKFADERNSSGKLDFEHSYLRRQINELASIEYGKAGLSIFDVALLLKVSTPSAEFDKTVGKGIMREILTLIYEYAQTMVLEADLDGIYGKFVLEQFEMFDKNIDWYMDNWKDNFSDYINDLMRIAVSDIERKKLTDIYEKMRKIMKESSKKRG